MGLGVLTLFGIVYPINFLLALTAVKYAVSRSILDIIRVTFPKQLIWFNDNDVAVGCIGISLLMAYSLVSVATGIQAMSSEGYDNHYGRFQLSRGKPGLGLRMYASHYNALECFTMFSIAVIVGIIRGIDGHMLANLSVLVIIARLFYHIFHAMDFAMARSVAFDTAFMAIITIMIEAALPGNNVAKFLTSNDWTLPNILPSN